MNKREYNTHIVFDVSDMNDIEKVNQEKVDKPYSIRHIRIEGEYTFMTISKFSINSEMLEKNVYKIDSNDNEVQCIEYDKNDNLIRRTEYENYPSGEIKRLHAYDDKNNLIYEEFYDEDD